MFSYWSHNMAKESQHIHIEEKNNWPREEGRNCPPDKLVWPPTQVPNIEKDVSYIEFRITESWECCAGEMFGYLFPSYLYPPCALLFIATRLQRWHDLWNLQGNVHRLRSTLWGGSFTNKTSKLLSLACIVHPSNASTVGKLRKWHQLGMYGREPLFEKY